MKTNATSGITGTAGTPLSHQAIQSGRDSIRRDQVPIKNEAISDTLETSDRDGDGKQPIVIENNQADKSNRDKSNREQTADNGRPDGLDLLG